MADPALPSTLMDEIKDLRRRVERMEMAGRLTSASMEQGTITIRDAAGAARVVLGLQADGSYGITVQNSTGRKVLTVGNTGMTGPRHSAAFFQSASSFPLTGATGTTSATMAELLRADMWSTSPTVNVQVYTNINGGGTGEWELTVIEPGASTPAVLDTWTTIGPNGGTYTVPSSCLVAGSGTDPVARTLTFRVNGRRTSGVGTVYVAPIFLYPA